MAQRALWLPWRRDRAESETTPAERGIGPSGNGAASSSFAAMSADGTRVFFTSLDQILAEDTDSAADLYERLPGSATTNRVSRGAAAGSGNGSSNATFEAQSADSAHVFFSTDERPGM